MYVIEYPRKRIINNQKFNEKKGKLLSKRRKFLMGDQHYMKVMKQPV